jgi:hypothetical protein
MGAHRINNSSVLACPRGLWSCDKRSTQLQRMIRDVVHIIASYAIGRSYPMMRGSTVLTTGPVA